MPNPPQNPTITHTSSMPDGSDSNQPSSGSETIAQTPDDVANAAARSAGAHTSLVSIPGYVVERELGRGGMGVVYLAKHLALNRMVALKMILSGEHSGERDRQRFLAEAEAIARLQHPNIVQLYEIGTHGDCPFFTLEFCEGGALDTKLGAQPITATEAGTLVETLARAMQVAHEAGIVHRDLKPQNVLLAADGAPKVTDFGLAKRVGGGSDLTASGAVLGTPSYMSPEQAAGKVKEVGPAADIYALGAILYAALTGRPPFHAATAVDTIMQVVHEDPVPPTQLVPGISRDLETICLKCLRKDPARRYATAASLADDLRRWHDGEPIAARPVGSAERIWKWARRRPTTAALVVASVLVAIGLAAAGVWFTDRLRIQRNLAQAAERAEQTRSRELVLSLEDTKRERDEKEKARRAESALKEEAIENDKALRAVIVTLVKLMQENAARSHGAVLDIPSLLAVAHKEIEATPTENRRARLGMLQMVGLLYTAFGRSAEAVPIFEELVALCRVVYGENHRETLSTMTNLAQIYIMAGQPLKGLVMLSQVISRQEASLDPSDPSLVESKQALARIYLVSQQYDKVLPLCDHVIADLRRLCGPDSTDTLEFLDIAATASAGAKLFDREETYLRELIRITAIMYGKSSERTTHVMARLALQLLTHEKWVAAETVLRECLAIREELAQRPRSILPKWIVFNTRSMLGAALLGQKKFAEAEPLVVDSAEKLLADQGSVPPRDRPNLQRAIDRVVQFYTATGNAEKAAEWRSRTVPMLPKSGSP
ncbi:MAG: protein kinase [Planctomycetes bacterium]|nr:protein kinase [Planctomycetota bacterium]